MARRVLSLSLLLAACYSSHEPSVDMVPGAAGGEPPLGAQLGPLSYYRDVKPISDEKCTQCHAPGGMGHFSLTSFDEVAPLARIIKSVVDSGRMPPWRATGPLDVYVGDRRLPPDQKKIISAWVDQGAPMGAPTESPPPRTPERRGLPRVDSTIPIPGPYTPLVEPDNYRCFVMDWPHTTTKYITGLSIEPDNRAMVHHAIVYLINPENVSRIRERDAADPGPGFDCYGLDPERGRWVTSYEPGGYGQENPAGLGFEVKPGSLVVLQMHYNTLSVKGSDSSSVQFMLADQVPKVGNVHLILSPLWLAGFMRVPANNPDVVHRWQGRPGGLNNNMAYDLYWLDLHMHRLGKSGQIGIVRAGSTEPELLLDVPDYSFEWQETYRLKQPVRLNPGDQLFVECRFDNTAERQTEVNGQRLPVRDVEWGENTTDEMCLGNVLATPATP
jgi:hypothetical protein